MSEHTLRSSELGYIMGKTPFYRLNVTRFSTYKGASAQCTTFLAFLGLIHVTLLERVCSAE
jgi:hypothetical protein